MTKRNIHLSAEQQRSFDFTAAPEGSPSASGRISDSVEVAQRSAALELPPASLGCTIAVTDSANAESQPKTVCAAPPVDLPAADLDAVDLWISARCPEAACSGLARHEHTARQYRREAERFLLWLNRARKQDLKSATIADAIAYRAFLADPQPRELWCARRGTPKESPAWRPFEGPLSAKSARQAMVVLSSFYRFLVEQALTSRNPFSGVAKPQVAQAEFDATRSLTASQWGAVRSMMTMMTVHKSPEANPRLHQLVWVIDLLYSTGIRLSELVDAQLKDLTWKEFGPSSPSGEQEDDALAGGWCLSVNGKGGVRRNVPVPTHLIVQLESLVAIADGGATSGFDACNRSRPLLVRWQRDGSRNWTETGPLGGQGVYLQIRRFMSRVAEGPRTAGRDADAAALEQASTHWLRHTHGTHAVSSGVPLDVVRCNLGHASLTTTTLYTGPELERRVQLTQSRFFSQDGVQHGSGAVPAKCDPVAPRLVQREHRAS